MIGNSIGLRGDGFVELASESNLKIITFLFSTEDLDSILLIQGSNDGEDYFEVAGKLIKIYI
jgi:hypothetical protein